MEIVIKIPMQDVLFIKDKTRYNKECYEIMRPIFGCNFLFAKYDDVNEDAYIEIGRFQGEKFVSRIQGYSDAINKEKVGVGGVYINVDVIMPELTLELKTR